MGVQAERKHLISIDLRKYALRSGLIVGACVLGVMIAGVGSGSTVKTLAIGTVVLVAIGGLISLALELPVAAILRVAFVASFFFKSDFNLVALNEIEDPSGLNLSLTLLTGVALLVHDRLFEEKRGAIFPRTFTFTFAALFILALLSVLYAGSTGLGWASVASLATSIFIAYVTAYSFSDREKIVQLITIIGVCVLATGLTALAQYTIDWPTDLSLLGTGTEEERLGTQSEVLSRVPAFLRTPTEMAWVISVLIPIVAAPLICRVRAFSSIQKGILFVGGSAGMIGVVLSLARGSWIGLLAAIVILALTGWIGLDRREKRSYILSVGAGVVLICALLLPFSERIYDRVMEDDKGSSAIRIPMFDNAYLMIEDNPILGVGMNGYRTNMTRYDETGIFVSQIFPNPVHNVFMHVTVEIGIPGGILFCLLFLFAFYECIKAMFTGDRLLFALGIGISAGLVAFILSGMKEPAAIGSVRAPMRTLFFVLGMVFALSLIRKQAETLLDKGESKTGPNLRRPSQLKRAGNNRPLTLSRSIRL